MAVDEFNAKGASREEDRDPHEDDKFKPDEGAFPCPGAPAEGEGDFLGGHDQQRVTMASENL